MSSSRQEILIKANTVSEKPKSILAPLQPKVDIDKLYGKDLFSLRVMRQRLPQETYKFMEKVINNGERLTEEVANIVANAMKDWAREHGATHFTHWFQPMTGTTAEKHDALFMPNAEGQLINKFSGKMLISGEPDASSFPSGGLRSTFEARGYTAWDPTVPAFIVPGEHGHTLNIPSVFYSYSGEALDRKIPLLRSIDAVSASSLRILRLFGNEKARFVRPMVGAEQEYFLIDSRLAALRPDLLLTGRTLLGASSPKGQEMEDHYFGATPARVMAFMQDLEIKLYALGIPVHTRHNEVAPGQFELAPVYNEVNLATDQNMMTMNILKSTAAEHGFVCLLHEKPFAGVNGSGKHNNFSLGDSEGNNLLDPGETPLENAQFLVFLAGLLKAVHNHSDMLRLGTISAGNDHRLGANEAPPAIISVYLGELLTEVLDTIIAGKSSMSTKSSKMEIGVSSLPMLPRDFSDRNRTSPFAFTGNKFEFRALGSSHSIAPINIAINTAMACALDDIAQDLEKLLKKDKDITNVLQEYLPKVFKEHMPVVFNGNGYSEEWHKEAAKRGLLNLKNTVEALDIYNTKNVKDAFARFEVLNEREVIARQEILFDTYAKSIQIEATVLINLVKERILPVVQEAQRKLGELAVSTKAVMGEAKAEEDFFKQVRSAVLGLSVDIEKLQVQLDKTATIEDVEKQAHDALDTLIPLMESCRVYADSLERIVNDKEWPLPKYFELLWTH